MLSSAARESSPPMIPDRLSGPPTHAEINHQEVILEGLKQQMVETQREIDLTFNEIASTHDNLRELDQIKSAHERTEEEQRQVQAVKDDLAASAKELISLRKKLNRAAQELREAIRASQPQESKMNRDTIPSPPPEHRDTPVSRQTIPHGFRFSDTYQDSIVPAEPIDEKGDEHPTDPDLRRSTIIPPEPTEPAEQEPSIVVPDHAALENEARAQKIREMEANIAVLSAQIPDLLKYIRPLENKLRQRGYSVDDVIAMAEGKSILKGKFEDSVRGAISSLGKIPLVGKIFKTPDDEPSRQQLIDRWEKLQRAIDKSEKELREQKQRLRSIKRGQQYSQQRDSPSYIPVLDRTKEEKASVKQKAKEARKEFEAKEALKRAKKLEQETRQVNLKKMLLLEKGTKEIEQQLMDKKEDRVGKREFELFQKWHNTMIQKYAELPSVKDFIWKVNGKIIQFPIDGINEKYQKSRIEAGKSLQNIFEFLKLVKHEHRKKEEDWARKREIQELESLEEYTQGVKEKLSERLRHLPENIDAWVLFRDEMTKMENVILKQHILPNVDPSMAQFLVRPMRTPKQFEENHPHHGWTEPNPQDEKNYQRLWSEVQNSIQQIQRIIEDAKKLPKEKSFESAIRQMDPHLQNCLPGYFLGTFYRLPDSSRRAIEESTPQTRDANIGQAMTSGMNEQDATKLVDAALNAQEEAKSLSQLQQSIANDVEIIEQRPIRKARIINILGTSEISKSIFELSSTVLDEAEELSVLETQNKTMRLSKKEMQRYVELKNHRIKLEELKKELLSDSSQRQNFENRFLTYRSLLAEHKEQRDR